MLLFITRRVLISIPVLLLASILTFVLIDAFSDPLAALRLMQPPPSEEVLATASERLYLDRNLVERYWLWLTGIGGNGDIGILRGQWGPSVRGTAFDIGQEIGDRFWITLRLIGASIALAIGAGILSGVVSALRQYSTIDYVLTSIGFVCLAMPVFWIGAIVREAGTFVNQQLTEPVFFVLGAASSDTRGFTRWDLIVDGAGHLILPTLALFLTGYAALSRYQRASMLEVMNADYVRLARAKGLRNRTVVRRHILRTALIPITTLSVLLIVGIIDGAVLTETVFQWRGLGTFLIESIQRSDSYAVLAFLVLSGTVTVLGNLVADILYGYLDPRIRV